MIETRTGGQADCQLGHAIQGLTGRMLPAREKPRILYREFQDGNLQTDDSRPRPLRQPPMGKDRLENQGQGINGSAVRPRQA